MSKKAKKRGAGHGRLPLKTIRPTYRDLAALEILSDKMGGLPDADVWRIGLHQLVEFKGLQEQVAKKAHLLETMGA